MQDTCYSCLECYLHDDDLKHIPKGDDLANRYKYICGEAYDVCFKRYWMEVDSDKNNSDTKIQTRRGCGIEEEMIKNGFWGMDGSECSTKIDDIYYNYTTTVKTEITTCGCTTDYCNTSTSATPFHFLPLIALSFVKILFIS